MSSLTLASSRAQDSSLPLWENSRLVQMTRHTGEAISEPSKTIHSEWSVCMPQTRHVPPLPYIMLQPNRTAYSFLKCQAISRLGALFSCSLPPINSASVVPSKHLFIFQASPFLWSFVFWHLGGYYLLSTCHVPGNMQRSSFDLLDSPMKEAFLAPYLKVIKLRFREIKWFSQVYLAYRWCNWVRNSDHCDPILALI